MTVGNNFTTSTIILVATTSNSNTIRTVDDEINYAVVVAVVEENLVTVRTW